MLVQVAKTITSVETVDIELPYYYKHDLLLDHADWIIYGKIEAEKHTKVQIKESYSGRTNYYPSVEVEIEATSWSSSSCYLNHKYKSDAETYEAAKNKALAIIKNA